MVHIDFWELSEEIPAGEKSKVVRGSIFDIFPRQQIEDFDVDDMVFAATVFGSQGSDLNARSLISPKIKQLAKTYDVKVVNFEVAE